MYEKKYAIIPNIGQRFDNIWSLAQRYNITEFANQIRMLWEQHITWTRLAIISTVFDLPDAEPVSNRLLQNPKDFELALEPFYGSENASRFADLLSSHLKIASQLVSAANKGDNNAAEAFEKDWYLNADEIATFFREHKSILV